MLEIKKVPGPRSWSWAFLLVQKSFYWEELTTRSAESEHLREKGTNIRKIELEPVYTRISRQMFNVLIQAGKI